MLPQPPQRPFEVSIPSKGRSAFTLIELLIVVAIIAILAAIAVPNFLEAQTRAKTSRVKADLRTLVTAIEAYAVDNNKYPADDENASQDARNLSQLGLVTNYAASPFRTIADGYMGYVGRVTTPISYITSGLVDPFSQIKNTFGRARNEYGWDLYELWGTPFTTNADILKVFPDTTQYLLWSYGPDGTKDNPGAQGIDNLYDPTNGTISRGNIYRAGPGNTQRVGQ